MLNVKAESMKHTLLCTGNYDRTGIYTNYKKKIMNDYGCIWSNLMVEEML